MDGGEIENFAGCISSAGPNSGHTSYFAGNRIVLKQLPTFAVHAHLHGHTIPVYLSAGAVIDVDTLIDEALRYPNIPIYVHPNAAVVTQADREEEGEGSIAEVAGTRSGTGAALARKIKRDPMAIWKSHDVLGALGPDNISTLNHNLKPWENAYFIEVAQGFSLGINSEFYPKVTSRECTVMQALADARIPPRAVVKTYLCVRSFPIRVGNVDNYSSGDWYEDQDELTWDDIGVTPERTTVTNRIRRVATFSDIQLEDAIRANDPDWIAISHLDYLATTSQNDAIKALKQLAEDGRFRSFGVIGGWGAGIEDWVII